MFLVLVVNSGFNITRDWQRALCDVGIFVTSYDKTTPRFCDFAILYLYKPYAFHHSASDRLHIYHCSEKTVTFNVTFLNYGLVKTGGNNVLNKISEIS